MRERGLKNRDCNAADGVVPAMAATEGNATGGHRRAPISDETRARMRASYLRRKHGRVIDEGESCAFAVGDDFDEMGF